jgi:hypothetical protein
MNDRQTSSYRDPGKVTHDSFKELSVGNDYVALAEAIVSLALYDADRVFCERNLVELAEHEDQRVRGNAILGFGHIARRFGECSPEVRELIEAASRDESEYVRGQATSAVDDLTFFLGWQFDSIDG